MKWNDVNDDGCIRTAMTTITCLSTSSSPCCSACLLIMEFVEGPTVLEGTDDDDPFLGTGGDVPGPQTFLTTLAASSSMPACMR